MTFYLKRDPDGVRVQGMQPETVPILLVARDVFREHGVDCVWTGGTEDGHDTIIHPIGFAMDFRINHIDSVLASTIAGEMAARLNIKEYDVVLKQDHIHVEFDPR